MSTAPEKIESAVAKQKEVVKQLEEKTKEIEDLKKQLAENNLVQEEPEEDTSIYYPPATNQDLTKKVESYRNFVADYVVKSHIEKYHAVKTAEQKMRDYYEGLIAEMKAGGAE